MSIKYNLNTLLYTKYYAIIFIYNTNTKFMQALFAVQTVFVFDVFNKDELMSDIREL
jgi:hypothetical protein